MRSLLVFMFIVLTTVSAMAQGCGPNPMSMVPTQQFNQPIQQSQAQQQAKQIQVIQAQADFQANTQKLQTQFRIQQIQNSGNQSAMQSAAQNFQTSMQALNQAFQQQMQALQRQ
jgi:hypothetical protein